MATVGIDVGGTKLLAVLVDDAGRVLEETSSPSPLDGEDLVAQMVEAALSLASGPPTSIGVGVPGVVDPEGSLVFAPNLPGALGIRLAAELEERLGGPGTWVGNDANAACWGEYSAGAGVGRTGMLMAALGTGIGGGIVVGGRLHEGAHGFAAELGHMVVDPSGPPCPCGKRGCWERFASGSALGLMAREAAQSGSAPAIIALAGGDPDAIRGEHVTAAASGGDADAREILRRFGWWVALGLANLAAALDPPLVVVGGGLAEAGEILMVPVRAEFEEMLVASDVRPAVPVVAARLGRRAGAIGAALLARNPGVGPKDAGATAPRH